MPAPDPAPDVITEADDGSTFALRRGDARALRLSNDSLWDLPEVSGGAVELVPVDYLVDPGYTEWQVDAVAAGTAEVAVAGSASCGDAAACPPRTVTLRFQVEG
ncbi:MAG: hypothetical protein GEU81_03555 [Nitriliruptorales bacterium]|nr:hypothetical protein [Nitriliruptorales bacterium]